MRLIVDGDGSWNKNNLTVDDDMKGYVLLSVHPDDEHYLVGTTVRISRHQLYRLGVMFGIEKAPGLSEPGEVNREV